MGALKTILLGLMLTFGASLAAMPLGVREQAQSFASCLGRYSATMEHEWLLGRDGADALERRHLFESLLEAIRVDANHEGLTGSEILNIRIEAKFAQARLLQLATFSENNQRATQARLRANSLLGTCQSLVFG